MLDRMRTLTEDRERGFTLIELLVVIIIIGILAAIAIPVFLNQRKKGVDASLKSDLKSAATIVETYATDHAGSLMDEAGVAPITIAAINDTTDYNFRPSSGNVVELTATTAGTYCISASNPGASDDFTGTTKMIYDSDKGGLQAAAGVCA